MFRGDQPRSHAIECGKFPPLRDSPFVLHYDDSLPTQCDSRYYDPQKIIGVLLLLTGSGFCPNSGMRLMADIGIGFHKA
jgi:hypothetical protein